jgi:hypothetical protein
MDSKHTGLGGCILTGGQDGLQQDYLRMDFYDSAAR